MRNTATGLQDIAPSIRESATALGLTSGARLRRIYLPIASRTNPCRNQNQRGHQHRHSHAGSADRRWRIRRTDYQRTELERSCHDSEGAIPAALLALLVQFFFDLLDRVLIPRGLRL